VESLLNSISARPRSSALWRNEIGLSQFAPPSVEIQTPLMTRDKEDYYYTYDDDVEVLEMLYKDEDISMLIILPRNNMSEPYGPRAQTYDFSEVEATLTAEKITKWRSQLKKEQVKVFFPKYKFDTDYDLGESLKKLGMPSVFIQGTADLSGMDGSNELYLDKALHKAYIDVDEEGTEAAAITFLRMAGAALSPEFYVDHPFIFIIQERETGLILFMGRVMNPSI